MRTVLSASCGASRVHDGGARSWSSGVTPLHYVSMNDQLLEALRRTRHLAV